MTFRRATIADAHAIVAFLEQQMSAQPDLKGRAQWPPRLVDQLLTTPNYITQVEEHHGRITALVYGYFHKRKRSGHRVLETPFVIVSGYADDNERLAKVFAFIATAIAHSINDGLYTADTWLHTDLDPTCMGTALMQRVGVEAANPDTTYIKAGQLRTLCESLAAAARTPPQT